MYNGKVRLWVTYHWGNDEHNNDTTVCDEVIEQIQVSNRLWAIATGAWHYDDGFKIGDWDEHPEHLDCPQEGDNWLQMVTNPWEDDNDHYFLAVITPAE